MCGTQTNFFFSEMGTKAEKQWVMLIDARIPVMWGPINIDTVYGAFSGPTLTIWQNYMDVMHGAKENQTFPRSAVVHLHMKPSEMP